MMSIEDFNKSVTNGNTFVVDYTRATRNARGVEFYDEVPTDITSFALLQNTHTGARKVSYYRINFEQNSALMNGHRQCECMMKSVVGKKPWLLLVEMKYCDEANISINSEDAFIQLKRTLAFLRENGVVDEHDRIYLNVAIPPHSQYEPFDAFKTTQVEMLDEYERNKIIVYAYNHLEIQTESYLMPIKREI